MKTLNELKIWYIQRLISRIKQKLPDDIFSVLNKGLCGVMAIYFHDNLKVMYNSKIIGVFNKDKDIPSHFFVCVELDKVPHYIDISGIFLNVTSKIREPEIWGSKMCKLFCKNI